ncbi:hypothetical protein Tco_1507459 [Tanacetum coccineum]
MPKMHEMKLNAKNAANIVKLSNEAYIRTYGAEKDVSWISHSANNVIAFFLAAFHHFLLDGNGNDALGIGALVELPVEIYRGKQESNFDLRPTEPITRNSLLKLVPQRLGTHTLGYVMVNVAISGWTVLIKMTSPTSYTTLFNRFYGGGSWGLVLSVENQCPNHVFEFSNNFRLDCRGGRAIPHSKKWEKHKLTDVFGTFGSIIVEQDLVEITDVTSGSSLSFPKNWLVLDKIQKTRLDFNIHLHVSQDWMIQQKFVGLVVVDVYGLENDFFGDNLSHRSALGMERDCQHGLYKAGMGSSRVLSDFAEKYGSKNRVLAGFGIGGKSGKEKVYKLGGELAVWSPQVV